MGEGPSANLKVPTQSVQLRFARLQKNQPQWRRIRDMGRAQCHDASWSMRLAQLRCFSSFRCAVLVRSSIFKTHGV